MEQVQITAFSLFGLVALMGIIIAYLVRKISELKDIIKILRNDKLYYMSSERTLLEKNQDLTSKLASIQGQFGINDK